MSQVISLTQSSLSLEFNVPKMSTLGNHAKKPLVLGTSIHADFTPLEKKSYQLIYQPSISLHLSSNQFIISFAFMIF